MEQSSKKRSRGAKVEKIILSTLMMGGVLTFAALAPNAVQLLKHIDPNWVLKRDPQQRLRESVYRLKHKGLLEFKVEAGKKRLRLTTKGEKVVNSIWSDTYKLKTPQRWDGKWRLVIFDIPERQRITRDKIRMLVSRLGFLRLQNSVWVYPYDCEEVVTLLKTDLKIGKAVLYIIADAIEFDKPLRQHFNLRSA